MSRRLTLYTRQGCHLCEEMKRILRQLAGEIAFEVEEIDVDGSADFREKFGEEVPVLFIDGRKAFKYRVTAGELRKQLRRAASSNL